MSVNSDMDKAIIALAKAEEQFAAMQARALEAHRDETTAMNRVNEAQKKFDELVASIKKSAPRDSDWYRKNTPVRMDME